MQLPESTAEAVRTYLRAGGSKIVLAMALGCRCTATIDRWIAAGEVPRWRRHEVMRILTNLTKKGR